MRLKKAQKEKLLEWVAAGLRTDEINAKAAEFKPPFSVSRGQVDYYRKTRRVSIDELAKQSEDEALVTGLSIKAERVKRLQMLAALMEEDLFYGQMWIDDIKGVGTGDIAQIVEFERFNQSEIAEYRATLDDIARELGQRITKQELTGKNGGPIEHNVHIYVPDNGRPRTN